LLHRGFKALKQSTKLLFLSLHRPHDALKTYTQLLTYTKSAVTRNYSEKTINGILDYVGGGKGGPVEVDVLEKFYQATKDALIEAKNEVNHILFVQWGADFNLFCRGSRSRRI
jgi:COP9 signalosome complex subunit 2